MNDSTVSLHSTIPVPQHIEPSIDFWEVLRSFDNQSLWRSFHCHGDGKWIHQGLLAGTLVIVHEGSYMVEVANDVCSAAFMIYCQRTKQKAKGVVAEKSRDADNYRGEILGGLIVQLVLRAASQ